MKDTATIHLKNIEERASYASRHFYISILSSDEYSSNVKSVLARLRNNLVRGLNKCVAIPKIILIVLEDSIINDVPVCDFGLKVEYEVRLKWLISQYRKLIESFIDLIPFKSRKDNWPKFLYLCPSLHNNYRNNTLRKKFTRSLEDICSYSEKSSAIRLRHGWDQDDNNIYLEQQQRFTTEGLASFWNATDKVIEDYDQNIFDKVDAPLEHEYRNDYKWVSPSYQAQQGNRRHGRGRGGAGNWRNNRYN